MNSLNLIEHELTHNKEASNLNIIGKYTQNNNQIYTKYLLIMIMKIKKYRTKSNKNTDIKDNYFMKRKK